MTAYKDSKNGDIKMRLLVWKKWRELKKSPIKLTLCLITPFIIVFAYYYLLHLKFINLFVITPFVVTLFITYLFFTVDEIAYSIYYIALGIKIHKVWKTNILFIAVWGYLLTNLALLLLAIIHSQSITLDMVLINIGSILAAMALIGLSTIHFIDNGLTSSIIASVFSILNLLMPALPPFIHYSSQYKMIGIVICAVAAITFYVCDLKMKKADTENLIKNTQVYINAYDAKFIDEEE
jgi:hypothetical protein